MGSLHFPENSHYFFPHVYKCMNMNSPLFNS
jgi:hypothetical protein